MREWVYEVHVQQREYGEHTFQLYGREESGQLRLVDAWDSAPFDTPLERWGRVSIKLMVDSDLHRV